MNWLFLLTRDATIPALANVKLSDRDKALLVSALNYLQEREAWQDLSDAEWDTIEAYIGDLSDAIS